MPPRLQRRSIAANDREARRFAERSRITISWLKRPERREESREKRPVVKRGNLLSTLPLASPGSPIAAIDVFLFACQLRARFPFLISLRAFVGIRDHVVMASIALSAPPSPALWYMPIGSFL